MICIIDYGLGNVGSLLNMCKRIGMEAVISSEDQDIFNATHLLLPGVGAFDTGMKKLAERNLPAILNKVVIDRGTPIMGICLGAQLMLNLSEEGVLNGLGWINGKVVKFKNNDIKVPHMGWNNLNGISDSVLFCDLPENPPRFYFVHSFHFEIINSEEIVAGCNYGYNFTAAFRRDNIFGVQFHPEKSHKFGMQLLTNFFSIK